MKQKDLVTVIIPYYNRRNFLSLVIAGFARQSDTHFEVIIAEDNDDPQNAKAIQAHQSQYPQLRIKHVYQPDAGFRKNKILNEATRIAAGQLLIFVDSDCIPHRHLVRQHRSLARPGFAAAGRRVFLGEKFTHHLLHAERPEPFSFLALAQADNRRIEEGIYFPWLPGYFNRPRSLLGCNWSIHRADLLSINGHDEDYQWAGAGEDSDIEWRLRKAGIRTSSVKFRAIVYHLHHSANYSADDANVSMDLLTEKKKQGIVCCQNGFSKLEKP